MAARVRVQAAYLTPDGRHKLVRRPMPGVCDWEDASYMSPAQWGEGEFLFDLEEDPTESARHVTRACSCS